MICKARHLFLKRESILPFTLAIIFASISAPAAAQNVVTFAYDNVGRTTMIQRGDGMKYQYTYDQNGNTTLQQVTSTTAALGVSPQNGWWWNAGQPGLVRL